MGSPQIIPLLLLFANEESAKEKVYQYATVSRAMTFALIKPKGAFQAIALVSSLRKGR